jgi:hypothetical protein
VRFRVLCAPQIIDHTVVSTITTGRELLRNSRQARLIEVTLPVDFSTQASNRALRVRFHEQSEPSFDGSFLSAGAAVPHRLAHQTVIDVYICAHENNLCA